MPSGVIHGNKLRNGIKIMHIEPLFEPKFYCSRFMLLLYGSKPKMSY